MRAGSRRGSRPAPTSSSSGAGGPDALGGALHEARQSIARDDPTERRYQASRYCFPQGSLYASGFAGVTMGIARSLLEDFLALARDKTPRGYQRALRESAATQSRVARAQAQLDSARVYLLSSLREIWRDVGRSGALGLDQRVTIRLAASYAIQQAREVADFA